VAPTSAGATESAVTLAPDATAVVAWKGTGFMGHQKIRYRVRAAFTGYGDIQSIGDLRNDEERPMLATDTDGRTWFAFHSITDDAMEVVRSTPTDPGSFNGGAIADFALAGAFSDVPDLAVQHDDAAVVYVDGGQVRLGHWTAAAGPSTTTMYDGSSGAGMHPRVTLDPAGNIVTAFTYDAGFGNPCFAKANRIPVGAPPAGIEDLGQTGIDEAPQCFDNDVDLALGPMGRVLASWYDEFGDSVQSRMAAQGAAFGPPATVASAGYNATTNPNPVAISLPSRARGLLGGSDATLHTYLTEPPSSTIGIAERVKPASGSPTTQQIDDGTGTVDLARNDSDQATGTWLGGSGACHVAGGRGTVGGGLTLIQPIGSCGSTTSEPRVAMDPGGDAAAAWTADGAVQLAVYDATPPELLSVNVPATATTGQLLDMSVGARDALTSTETEWELDDGSGAVGNAIQHSYAAAGNYHVLIHVRDLAGNVTDVQRTILVSDPPPGPSAPPAPPPTLPGGGETAGGGAPGAGGGGETAGGGASGGGGTEGIGGDARAGPVMTLTTSTLRASRRGVVKVALGCPQGTEGGCSGDVSIQQGALAAAATKLLAARPFAAAPGATVKAKLKLTASARRLLKRKRTLSVIVRATARDAAGRSATGQRNAVLVLARRPAKRH
jgi:PKD domain